MPGEVPLEPHDSNTARETPAPSRTTVSKRRLAMRMIRDPLHGMVLVYQMEASFEDRDLPALVLESSAWCVKLTEYPRNWRELPDDALLQLRQLAVPQHAS